MDEWTEQEFNEVLREVLRRAGCDREFRRNLLNNPRGTLQELAGKPLPETYEVRFTEDTDYCRTIVLPPLPSNEGQLSNEDLERVAGGVCIITIPDI